MTAIDSMGALRLGDTVLLITDGDDNASHIRPSLIKEKLMATGIRLFCCLLYCPPNDLPRGAAEEIYRQEMVRLRPLVEASGGKIDREEIAPDLPITQTQRAKSLLATTNLVTEASEFYRLGLKLPNRLDKRRDLKLSTVNAASSRGF